MVKHAQFREVVLAVARLSRDASTKVGAVAFGPNLEILAVGYNGLPRKVKELPERLERPDKLLWTAHAEENLVAQAARVGARLEGSTVMVSTLYPCANCSRMLIQAGVKRVLVVERSQEHRHTFWTQQAQDVSLQMLKEAGVEVAELCV